VPKRPHILVAGPVGVGKSTTARALSEALGLPLFLESAADLNPYLERFYTDMSRWALPSQMFFILESLDQARQIAESRAGAIQDRSVWEHLGIFIASLHVNGHLSDSDVRLLADAARLGLHGLPTPDLLLYLHAPQQTIEERIRGRGRSYEQRIDPEYLRTHIANYQQWVPSFDVCPVLSFDTSDFNPRWPANIDHLVRLIEQQLTAHPQSRD
jgi:deoxyadenosine/deoxycytidine kinase